MAGKHILIVEDEKPLSHALELKLQREGYETTIATNGLEALELIKKGTFSVVLLDMMMPVMDGFQLLQELEGMKDKPVIFVLSNLSQHEDESRILASGASKYFIKSNTPLAVIVDEIKKT